MDPLLFYTNQCTAHYSSVLFWIRFCLDQIKVIAFAHHFHTGQVRELLNFQRPSVRYGRLGFFMSRVSFTRVARLFSVLQTKMEKYLPNDQKIFSKCLYNNKMAIKYSQISNFPFEGLQKSTKIGIFVYTIWQTQWFHRGNQFAIKCQKWRSSNFSCLKYFRKRRDNFRETAAPLFERPQSKAG
jgi:hypothetical protein